VTYVLDRLSIALALIASLALLRQRQVAIAAFSLALIAVSQERMAQIGPWG